MIKKNVITEKNAEIDKLKQDLTDTQLLLQIRDTTITAHEKEMAIQRYNINLQEQEIGRLKNKLHISGMQYDQRIQTLKGLKEESDRKAEYLNEWYEKSLKEIDKLKSQDKSGEPK